MARAPTPGHRPITSPRVQHAVVVAPLETVGTKSSPGGHTNHFVSIALYVPVVLPAAKQRDSTRTRSRRHAHFGQKRIGARPVITALQSQISFSNDRRKCFGVSIYCENFVKFFLGSREILVIEPLCVEKVCHKLHSYPWLSKSVISRSRR